MMRKPIKIDWDELEDAFTNPADEFECYLDRVTGHVVLEGEGDDLDEDETAFDRTPVATPPPPRDDATRLYVHPPTADRKIEWMKAFLADSEWQDEDSAPVVAELAEALQTDDAPAVLSDVLNRNPDVRDNWYLYRTNCVREMIEAWLTTNEVEATAPPPWR